MFSKENAPTPSKNTPITGNRSDQQNLQYQGHTTTPSNEHDKNSQKRDQEEPRVLLENVSNEERAKSLPMSVKNLRSPEHSRIKIQTTITSTCPTCPPPHTEQAVGKLTTVAAIGRHWPYPPLVVHPCPPRPASTTPASARAGQGKSRTFQNEERLKSAQPIGQKIGKNSGPREFLIGSRPGAKQDPAFRN